MVSPGVLENSVCDTPVEEMPLGRYGTYEDVLHPIRFLLGEGSEALTGSNLHVGGGWNIALRTFGSRSDRPNRFLAARRHGQPLHAETRASQQILQRAAACSAGCGRVWSAGSDGLISIGLALRRQRPELPRSRRRSFRAHPHQILQAPSAPKRRVSHASVSGLSYCGSTDCIAAGSRPMSLADRREMRVGQKDIARSQNRPEESRDHRRRKIGHESKKSDQARKIIPQS